MTESDAIQQKFRSIGDPAHSSIRIKGSKFVGSISSTSSISEAERFIESVEAAYPDATHHVPAYRIRADPFREWESDDGEPGGSAGKPALNVLAGEDLENVVVVISRYFGGMKLGYGGLVRAYTQAVQSTIREAKIIECKPALDYILKVAYNDSGTVRGILESQNLKFDARYDEKFKFLVSISMEEIDSIRDRILSATNGRVRVDFVEYSSRKEKD